MARISSGEAVVLYKNRFRENSLILTLFTKDFGKVSLISKGALKKKLPLYSILEPFSIVKVSFYDKSNRHINIISEVSLLEKNAFLQLNILKFSIASLVVEIINKATFPRHVNQDIYNLLKKTLASLKYNSNIIVLNYFEINFLHFMGMMPNFDNCVSCGAKRGNSTAFISYTKGGILCEKCSGGEEEIDEYILRRIKRYKNFDNINGLGQNTDYESELRIKGIFHKFITYHLDIKLKSESFLKNISEFHNSISIRQ